MFPYDQENIVAIATPPGIGALAVVRLSGKDLKPLYKEFTHKQPKNRLFGRNNLKTSCLAETT